MIKKCMFVFDDRGSKINLNIYIEDSLQRSKADVKKPFICVHSILIYFFVFLFCFRILLLFCFALAASSFIQFHWNPVCVCEISRRKIFVWICARRLHFGAELVNLWPSSLSVLCVDLMISFLRAIFFSFYIFVQFQCGCSAMY